MMSQLRRPLRYNRIFTEPNKATDMKITIEIDCNGRNFDEKFTPNTAQRKDIFRNLMPDRDVLIMNVKEMISQGRTQRWIANELGIAVGTVNKYSKL